MNRQKRSKSEYESAKEYTRNYVRRLMIIIKQHTPKRLSRENGPTKSSPTQDSQEGSRLLLLMSFVPYLLTAIFIISFFWDFNGISLTLWNHTYFFNGLLRMMSVGGLIGFFTNWVAITMLFKPVKRHPLLGQGMIPANKDRIASRLAKTAADDIINPETIKQSIHQSGLIRNYRRQSSVYIKQIVDDPRFRQELRQWILQYIRNITGDPEIREALAQKIIEQVEHSIQERSFEQFAIKTYTFITGSKMQQIVEESLTGLPGSVESEFHRFDKLLDDVPDHIEANSDTIEDWLTTLLYKLINQLNVQQLIEGKLQDYDEQQLSDLISNTTSKQLRFIKYLGGILGIIGGFVIWAPVASLISLVVIGGVILFADYLWMRLEPT